MNATGVSTSLQQECSLYFVQHLYVAQNNADELSQIAMKSLKENDDRYAALERTFFSAFTENLEIKETLLHMLQLEGLTIFKERIGDLLNSLTRILEILARRDSSNARGEYGLAHLSEYVKETILPKLAENLLITLQAKVLPLSHNYSDMDSVFLEKVLNIRYQLLNCLLLMYVAFDFVRSMFVFLVAYLLAASAGI